MLTQTATVDNTDAAGTRTVIDYDARLQHAGATENSALGGDQLASVWLLFLPPGAIISGHAFVTVDDRRYSVDGEPAILQTPRGPHHIEARLLGIDVS